MIDGDAFVAAAAARLLTRLSTHSNFQSPVIQVVVGDAAETARTFLAHKGILCKSPFFSCALNGSFREARENTVMLPEDDPKIFSSVLEYLYAEEYSPRIVTRAGSRKSHTQSSAFANIFGHPVPYHLGSDGVIDSGSPARSDPSPLQSMLNRSAPVREIEGYDGTENPEQQCEAALRHAKIYCLAEKLGIGRLQTLVLEKLKLCGPVKDVLFVKVAAYLVENASDVDGQLTEFLTPYIPGIPSPPAGVAVTVFE